MDATAATLQTYRRADLGARSIINSSLGSRSGALSLIAGRCSSSIGQICTYELTIPFRDASSDQWLSTASLQQWLFICNYQNNAHLRQIR